MCTLTYLPTGKDSFIWTQNRDESPLRTSPGLVVSEDSKLVYPKEPLSGGTWISISKENRVVSLLNGAFEQNKYVLSNKRSRGLIVLDFFESSDARTFFEACELEGIEPFTMVIYEKGALWEFRWDKKKKYVKPLDSQQPYIWSSSTLYPAPVKALRKAWFKEYLATHSHFNKKSILTFHQEAGTGDIKNDLIMDRGMVKTVSITNIVKEKEQIAIEYIDLVNGGNTNQAIEIMDF